MPALNPLLRLMGEAAPKGAAPLPDALVRAKARKMRQTRLRDLRFALGR